MARQPESTPKITDPQHLLLLPELPELSWGGKGWRKSLKARIGKCPVPLQPPFINGAEPPTSEHLPNAYEAGRHPTSHVTS